MVTRGDYVPKAGSVGYRSRLCRSASQSRRSRNVWSLPRSSSPDRDYQTHEADGQSDYEGEVAPMNEGSDEVQNDRAMEGDGVAELEQGSVKDQSSDDPPEGSIIMAFTILADLDFRQEGAEKYAKDQSDRNKSTQQSLHTLRDRLVILEEEVKELRQIRDKGKDNVGGDRKTARSKRPMK